MGIEIPPPKGGPAVFTASSPGIRSTGELSPGEDSFRTPESREDLNDGGSVSLSEGRRSDGRRPLERCRIRGLTIAAVLCF